MDNHKLIEQMKIFQNYLLDFLDMDGASKENYDNIRKFYLSNLIDSKRKQLLLIFIKKVIHNHHHSPNFLDKIIQIFEIINPTYLEHPEIFNIFKNDKILLLLLFEREIMRNSDYNKRDYNNSKSKFYEYLSKEDEKIIKDHKYENDSIICELIRNDSIDDFIIYVNKNSIQLTNYKIEESIYETNAFLIGKNPTLIEYAAFFGSIQIFRYLNMNNVELTPSLWLYGIHSNNPEIIQILEEKKVEFSSTEILKEAIKCHHNEIAEYIINNHGEKIKKSDIDLYAIKCHNYKFYPSEFPNNDPIFFINACRYHQYFIVKDILEKTDDESMCNYTIEIPCKGIYIENKDDDDDDNYTDFDANRISFDYTGWGHKPFELESKRIKQRNLMKKKIYKLNGSALNFAVENEDIIMIDLLLKYCYEIDVNHKMIKYYDVKNDMLSYEYIDTKREEKTPLHIAIEKGNLKIVKMLCDNENIDVNMKTYDAYPKSGVDSRQMKTPINIAIENNNTPIASYLLHLPKFNVNKLSIDEVWWGGGREEYSEKTPLVLAVQKGNLTICQELLENYSSEIDVDKRYIEFYTMSNLSYLHKLKKTPLHIAIENKNCEIVKELLDHHSNIRAFDVKEYKFYHFERKKQLKTPLFLAIENKDIKMVELLLSYHDIDTKNGLLDLEGDQYPIRFRKYHPRIRNDIQKITDENKVAYFLRKKGNYSNGYFIESLKKRNDEKYLNMNEEEDFDDDYSFFYEIVEKISPMEAAEKIKNEEIESTVSYKCDIQYNQEEEERDEKDDDIKMFFCEDYYYS